MNHGWDGWDGAKRWNQFQVLIQAWGKAFANSKSFPIFAQVYQKLLQDGVVFPQPDKDETAPVFTPVAKVERWMVALVCNLSDMWYDF